MCVVSMVMDHFRDNWEPRIQPLGPSFPNNNLNPLTEALKNMEPKITDAEIREFRKLLERAREYDKKNSEPECEMQEKKDALIAIAKQLGVDISFID